MKRFALFAAAALSIGASDCSTTDTDTKPSTGDTGTDCPYNGPISIDTASVTCTDTTHVEFVVDTIGVPSDGLVFSQETANETPNYSDEHTLVVTNEGACGESATLDRTLQTGVALASATENVSTVFSCAADTHYAADNVMTYAFMIFDDNGDLADCIVAGNDPSDVIAGTSNRVNDPTENLSSCDIGSISAAY